MITLFHLVLSCGSDLPCLVIVCLAIQVMLRLDKKKAAKARDDIEHDTRDASVSESNELDEKIVNENIKSAV